MKTRMSWAGRRSKVVAEDDFLSEYQLKPAKHETPTNSDLSF